MLLGRRAGPALAALAGAIALAVTPSAIPRNGTVWASPVDALLTGCPSAADRRRDQIRPDLSFERPIRRVERSSARRVPLRRSDRAQRPSTRSCASSRRRRSAGRCRGPTESLQRGSSRRSTGSASETTLTFRLLLRPAGYIDVKRHPSSYLVLTPRWIDPAIAAALRRRRALRPRGPAQQRQAAHLRSERPDAGRAPVRGAPSTTSGSGQRLYSAPCSTPPGQPHVYRASQIGKAELPLQRICTLPSANTVAHDRGRSRSGRFRRRPHLHRAHRQCRPDADDPARGLRSGGTRRGPTCAATASQGSCAGPAPARRGLSAVRSAPLRPVRRRR
jgi:hypothetical protein